MALRKTAQPALSGGALSQGGRRRKLALMNPLILFLLLFVGAPLVELYFLIEVGARIGAIPTVFLTVFTAGCWCACRGSPRRCG